MRRGSLVSACSFGLAMLPTFAVAQTYTISDLGVVPGGSASGTAALGISDNGYTTGKSDKPAGTPHAFFGNPGSLVDLGLPSGINFAIGTTVNSNRQVAGYLGTKKGGVTQYPKAARWSVAANGAVSVTTINPLGGTQCQAYGINDAGQVVGWSSVKLSSGGMHAFLWTNGTMVDLGGPPAGSDWRKATGINNNGVVVGRSGIGGWYRRPSDTAPISLPLGEANAVTVDGANHDIVAGSANDQAVLYDITAGAFVALTVNPAWTGTSSLADALNSVGQMVGRSDLGPFVYDPVNGMRALSGLFTQPAGLTWTLQQATGINSSGQICGFGYTMATGSTTKVYRGFLLSPTN